MFISILKLATLATERPVYTLPAAFHLDRSIVPQVSSRLNEVCMVSQWNMQAPLALQQKLFSPEARRGIGADHCETYRRWRQLRNDPRKILLVSYPFLTQVHTASCVDSLASDVYPCPEGGILNATPNKYCRAYDTKNVLNATELSVMDRCPRASVPLLIPSLEEWFMHPDNINHVGRDLAYAASMLNLGVKNGYDVFLPDLSNFRRLLPWGKNILQALEACGLRLGDWKDEVQRYAKVAFRMQKDAPVRDVSPEACGVVCVTEAVRLGGSGFIEPDDATILQQAVLESCGLPRRPPFNRTLLLITRKAGGTRVLANLPVVREVLISFATSYGLEYVEVNFGAHEFCAQVRYASHAYIMVGIQGADPSNMFFQHKDASLVELYGRECIFHP